MIKDPQASSLATLALNEKETLHSEKGGGDF